MAESKKFTRELSEVSQAARTPVPLPPSSSDQGDVLSLASFGIGLADKFRQAKELEELERKQELADESTARVQAAANDALMGWQDMRDLSEAHREKGLRAILRSHDLSPSESIAAHQLFNDTRLKTTTQELILLRRKKEEAAENEKNTKRELAIDYAKGLPVDLQSLFFKDGIPDDDEELFQYVTAAAEITHDRWKLEEDRKAAALAIEEGDSNAVMEIERVYAGIVGGSTIGLGLSMFQLAVDTTLTGEGEQAQIREIANIGSDLAEKMQRRLDSEHASYRAQIKDSTSLARLDEAYKLTSEQIVRFKSSFGDVADMNPKALKEQLTLAQDSMKLSAMQSFELISALKEAGGEALVTSVVQRLSVVDLELNRRLGSRVRRGIVDLLNSHGPDEKAELGRMVADYMTTATKLEDMGEGAESTAGVTWGGYYDTLSMDQETGMAGQNPEQMAANMSDILMFSRKAEDIDVAESSRNAMSLLSLPNFTPFFNTLSPQAKESLGRQVFATTSLALQDRTANNLFRQIRRVGEEPMVGVVLNADTGYAELVQEGQFADAPEVRHPHQARLNRDIEQFNDAIDLVREHYKYDPSLKDLSPAQATSFMLKQAEDLGLLEGITVRGKRVEIPEFEIRAQAQAQGVEPSEVREAMNRQERLDKIEAMLREAENQEVREQQRFDPEGEGYDYAAAAASGIVRDETGHMPSRNPKTGQILKGRGHPTFEKTLRAEEEAGFVIVKKEDGKYYSFPKDEVDDE